MVPDQLLEKDIGSVTVYGDKSRDVFIAIVCPIGCNVLWVVVLAKS